MDHEQNNIQSTKQLKPEMEVDEDKYFYPEMEKVKTYELCATITPFNVKEKNPTNLQEPYHTSEAMENYMSR